MTSYKNINFQIQVDSTLSDSCFKTYLKEFVVLFTEICNQKRKNGILSQEFANELIHSMNLSMKTYLDPRIQVGNLGFPVCVYFMHSAAGRWLVESDRQKLEPLIKNQDSVPLFLISTVVGTKNLQNLQKDSLTNNICEISGLVKQGKFVINKSERDISFVEQLICNLVIFMAS